jgi:hypothetical protein
VTFLDQLKKLDAVPSSYNKGILAGLLYVNRQAIIELVEAAEKAIPEMICTCSGELLCGRCNLYEALAKLKGDV